MQTFIFFFNSQVVELESEDHVSQCSFDII